MAQAVRGTEIFQIKCDVYWAYCRVFELLPANGNETASIITLYSTIIWVFFTNFGWKYYQFSKTCFQHSIIGSDFEFMVTKNSASIEKKMNVPKKLANFFTLMLVFSKNLFRLLLPAITRSWLPATALLPAMCPV